jgi:copper chaperone CopZ
MKTLKNIVALLVVVLVFASCKNDKQPEVKTVETTTNEVKELDANATYAKAEFTIEGMTCAMGCAKTIEKKMAKMEGVKSAKVDFDKRLAMVEYDEAKVTPSSLEEVVKKAGETYSVKDMKTVDVFNGKKESCKGDAKCSADCTDKDCAKCAAKKAECKKKCDAKKAEGEKMACADDCKKECCASKKA